MTKAKKSRGNVVDMYSAAQVRLDSWINTVTGLGTMARDKLMSGYFSRTPRLSDQELEDLYNGDDLAACICGAVVDDSLRSGYEIVIGVEDESADSVSEAAEMGGLIETELEDVLHASERIREAWTWGRLFGGAALYIVTDEGSDIPQSDPLEVDRLRRVLALMVLDKRDLIPHQVYSDPASPKFGSVETYLVNTVGPVGSVSAQIANVEIHESRMIIFDGALTTNRERRTNEGWSLSVLQRPYDVLRAFNASFQSLSTIMTDASQGIFAMDGLIDMIASGEKDAVQTRMALVDLQRSNARSLIIDAEKESFTRLVPPLGGYQQAIEMLMLRLAAAARMPVSVLFGRAPAGLNATGESDRLLWAQTVETEQSMVLDPAMTRLVELVMASSDGPTSGAVPESWDVKFPPLVHMTEKETAEIRRLVAETDALYLREGVLMPEEVAINRFRPTGYSYETTIQTGEREMMLDEDRSEEPPPVEDMSDEPEGREDAIEVRLDLIEERGGQWCVLSEAGDLIACHDTPAAAIRQLSAIEAAKRERNDAESMPAPKGAQEEAARGLEWRAEYGRGGTDVGVARARDLANGRAISPQTRARMRSYFARHEVDKQGQGWSPGEDGYPSAGRIAWALWGGDAGRRWVDSLRDRDTEE